MDNQPAFPLKEPLSNDALGITMLDYFAAKAMQGFAADPCTDQMTPEQIAAVAYKWADAMLKERKK